MVAVPAPGELWLTAAEKAALPLSGPRFEEVMRVANLPYGSEGLFKLNGGGQLPASLDINDLNTQNAAGGAHTVAKAYAYLATNQQGYVNEIKAALNEIMFSATKTRTLAIGRHVASYVVAADLINLRDLDAALHERFKGWLRYRKVANVYEWDGSYNGTVESLQDMTDTKPNNWSLAGGTSTLAIDMYLNNIDGVDHQANNIKSKVGEEAINLRYKENYRVLGTGTWQSDPANPLAVNPPGATIDGHDVDGAMPEEMRRTGEFSWPPAMTNYMWTALNGWFIQAHLLQRCGYTPELWGTNALQRMLTWIDTHGWVAGPDDFSGVPQGTGLKFWPGSSDIGELTNDVDTLPLINKVLGTTYPVDWSVFGAGYYGKPQTTIGHMYYAFGT